MPPIGALLGRRLVLSLALALALSLLRRGQVLPLLRLVAWLLIARRGRVPTVVVIPALGGDGGVRGAAEDRSEQRGQHGASPAGATEEAGQLIEAVGSHGAAPGGCRSAGCAARSRIGPC